MEDKDDSRTIPVDRRVTDVQFGSMIERIRHMETSVNGLIEKFDRWFNNFTEKCEKKHYHIDQLINTLIDRPTKKEFDVVKDRVKAHSIYWALLIGLPSLSGIIILIFTLIEKHLKSIQ
jgi:hypothetical protein